MNFTFIVGGQLFGALPQLRSMCMRSADSPLSPQKWKWFIEMATSTLKVDWW